MYTVWSYIDEKKHTFYIWVLTYVYIVLYERSEYKYWGIYICYFRHGWGARARTINFAFIYLQRLLFKNFLTVEKTHVILHLISWVGYTSGNCVSWRETVWFSGKSVILTETCWMDKMVRLLKIGKENKVVGMSFLTRHIWLWILVLLVTYCGPLSFLCLKW